MELVSFEDSRSSTLIPGKLYKTIAPKLLVYTNTNKSVLVEIPIYSTLLFLKERNYVHDFLRLEHELLFINKTQTIYLQLFDLNSWRLLIKPIL